MKKILKVFIFVIALFSFTKVKANTISNIKMDIYLDKDGTAHFTEKWNATLDQGTDGYKGYANLGEARITNFSVKDGYREYESLDSWNIDASFNDCHSNGGYVWCNVNYITYRLGKNGEIETTYGNFLCSLYLDGSACSEVENIAN